MGASQDLHVLREVTETVVEQLDDGVVVSTVDGRILYHNRAVRKLFGVLSDVPLQSLRQLGRFSWSKRVVKAALDSGEHDAVMRTSDRILRFEEKFTRGDCMCFLEFSVRRTRSPSSGGELRIIVVRDVTVRRQLEATFEETKTCGLITGNAGMLNLIERAKQVAKSDAAVLLQGESGVGKSCFARLIHEHSNRGRFPMVEVNCAAIPEALMECL